MFEKRDVIYAVYREGSFSKAAARLHISQPSLSVMVSRVEKEIGEKLFDRSTSPIKPTTIGKKYLASCEGIADIQNEFINYINETHGLTIGEFSLGGSSLYMSNVIPYLLSAYSSRYPGVKVNLFDSESLNLDRLLQDGSVDLIIDARQEDEQHLNKFYLGTEFLLLAIPAEFEINLNLANNAFTYEDVKAKKHTIDSEKFLNSISAFKDQPFVLMQKGYDTRVRSDEVFDAFGFKVEPLFELNQLYSTFAMASSGIGATVVSDTIVRNSSNWGRKMYYYRVKHDCFVRDIFFHTKKNRLVTHAMRAFINVSKNLQPLTEYKKIVDETELESLYISERI